MRYVFCLFLFVSCSSQQVNEVIETKNRPWHVESNKIAMEFTRDISEIYPEIGSSFGYGEFDKKGMNLNSKTLAKKKKLLKKWLKKLSNLVTKTHSKHLKADMMILKDYVQRDLDWINAEKKLAFIPFYAASELIYHHLATLINDQSPLKRKKDAVTRFKFYMNDKNKNNLVDAFLNETNRFEKKYKDLNKLYPYKGEVKKYLENSKSYVAGIKDLLEKSGRDDWKDAYQILKAKITYYDNYIKTNFLKKTRDKANLPFELYKMNLRDSGVTKEPVDLIKRGKKDYKQIYRQFITLAKKIAKKHSLKSDDPVSVIRYLKEKQVTSLQDVEKLYQNANRKLERIIKKHSLITLPKSELQIRLAGDVESKAKPVPHLNPPPLVNNDGILPEFVVPTSTTGELPFDDFSYESAAIILTAHEGRPGHDLQFSRIVENEVSFIRARYAMNSTNVEGWALYAEDLVFPYLDLEEKFIALQTRLWRVARYYLDPMVQIAQASSEDVIRVFHENLGVSKKMAELEYQRYAYRSPGQATAYYEGLLMINKLKDDLQQKYGKLNLKCFNDTFVSFGLLPPAKMKLFYEDFKKCKK